VQSLRPTTPRRPLALVATLSALLGVAALGQGCVQVRDSETVSFDGNGISFLSARNDRGDILVAGRSSGSSIDVTATTWGSGSREVRAQERQDTVSWSAEVDGNTLLLDGVALEGRSGVDFDVIAPTRMDVDAITDSGTVRLDDVEGIHVVTATQVVGSVVGDMDVYGTSSVDVDFVPYVETDTLIESDGSVTLAIPYGLEYDLTVRGDPSDTMEIAELGWDDLVLGEGFVNGLRGRGDVEIDIRAGGSVRIVELR